jgi:hypothetical protein
MPLKLLEDTPMIVVPKQSRRKNTSWLGRNEFTREACERREYFI